MAKKRQEQASSVNGPDLKLPDEVFDFLRELYPVGLNILEEAGLKVAEFFALSYLRNSDVKVAVDSSGTVTPEPGPDGRPARLNAHVNERLRRALDYQDTTVIAIINNLSERGLVNKTNITEPVRRVLYPSGLQGRHPTIVILTKPGEQLLGAVNARVNEKFNQLVDALGIRALVVGFLSGPILMTAMPRLLEAARQLKPHTPQPSSSERRKN